MDDTRCRPPFEQPALPADVSAALGRSGAFDHPAAMLRHDIDHQSPKRAKLSLEFIAVTTAVIDVLLVLVTAATVFAVYFQLFHYGTAEPAKYIGTALVATTVYVGTFERIDGYRFKRLQMLSWQISRISLVWSITVTILLLAAFVGKISGDYSRAWTLGWFLVTPVVLMIAHGLIHRAMAQCLKAGLLARSVVIVGAGDEGQSLAARLQNCEDKSIVITGIFDDRKSRCPRTVEGLRVLGTTDDLLRYARRERIDEIIVALPLDAEDRLRAMFEKLAVIPADLRLSVNTIAEQLSVRGVGYLANVPMLEIVDRPLKYGCSIYKFVEDRLLAIVALTLVGPLMMIIAVLIKLDSRGPVFFVQERFGFNNNVILVRKFRTMYVDQGDPSGAQRTVQNDPRVTRVGRVIRSLSLDELPQLINVLRGEMSLVGPRPHAIAMRAGDRLYEHAVAQYPHRHRVKPGMTGWAQVNGFRGEVDTLEKARGRIEYDLYYIDNWSLWLDLKILLMTLDNLISRAGAY